MIYIVSDLHIGHDRPFIYEARGFNSMLEHDAAIIQNINDTVGEEDTLYILGDLMLGINYEYSLGLLGKINCGDIRIIVGNHDTANKIERYRGMRNVSSVEFGGRLTYMHKNFVLSHYPCVTTNYDDDTKPWQRMHCLCGHSHTTDRFQDIRIGSYHVELDAHNNRPVSIEEIIADLREYNGL